MFTGLVETVGSIKSLSSRGDYKIISIESDLPMDQIEIGESIACDGSCLTVVSKSAHSFVVEASPETASRTIVGGYTIGARINIERALRVGDRLGGHFVSGHIDCVGVVESVRRVGESLVLETGYDATFSILAVEKGSIAINGVSLTINSCGEGSATVNLIPHTLERTNLKQLAAGSRTNLEFDLLGKYALKMQHDDVPETLTLRKLKESGW